MYRVLELKNFSPSEDKFKMTDYDEDFENLTVGRVIEKCQENPGGLDMPFYAVKKRLFTPTKPLIRTVYTGGKFYSGGEVRGNIEAVVLYAVSGDYPFPFYSEHPPVSDVEELVEQLEKYDPKLPCVECYSHLDDFNRDTIPIESFRCITSVMTYPGYYDGSLKWYTTKDGMITGINSTRNGHKVVVEGMRGSNLFYIAEMINVFPDFVDVEEKVKQELTETYKKYKKDCAWRHEKK